MRKLLLAVVILFFVQHVQAQNDETKIRSLLEKQRLAWNKGNIDEFMHGYWNSDSLLFVGSNGPRYGYKNTLENYKKSYPDAAHMGQLVFNILSVKKLSADHAFVLGKWKLNRSAGDVEGMFTLILRKIKGAWVIISDHSS